MLIRWSCLFPRLILLVLLILAVWQGRAALLSWQLEQMFERQTGADVSIGTIQENLQRNEIVLERFTLADPKEKHKKLCQIKKITAAVDRNDLLYRRFHFSEITAEGIQIVLEHADGEQLIPDKLWTKLSQHLPADLRDAAGLDWAVFLNAKPEAAVQKLLQQLKSPQRIQDLKKRYPKETERFETLATLVKSRFQNIKVLAEKGGKTNDKLQLLNEILKELDAADIGIQQLLQSAVQLKESTKNDYEVLTETVKQDTATLKKLRSPKLETGHFAEYLIGQEIREQWNKTVAWGDWARSLLVPVETQQAQEIPNGIIPVYGRFGLTPPKSVRGETVFLISQESVPEITVDAINLTGQVFFGTVPVFFNGAVRNVVSPMMLGSEPIVVQCCFSGAGIPTASVLPEQNAAEPFPAAIHPNSIPNIFVTLSIDRTAEHKDDQLIVCCPKYSLPERLIGNPGAFAVAVSPGTSKLDGVILMQGENLSGQIRVVQSGVNISLSLPEKSGFASLLPAFQQTLDSLNEFTADVMVSGTRSQPVYGFKSNIAEKLRPQIEVLAQQKWDLLKKQAENILLTEANQGTAVLNTVLQQHLDPVMDEINAVRTAWGKEVAAFSGMPLDQLTQQQLSKLSDKDRQRITAFLNTPFAQSLQQSLPPGQVPGDAVNSDSLDQTIQRGVDKLQDKIPGLLEKLRKK